MKLEKGKGFVKTAKYVKTNILKIRLYKKISC